MTGIASRKLIGAACLAILALAACSQEKSGALAPVKITTAELEASLEDLRAEVFVAKAGAATPADIPALIAAAPKSVAITYDTLTLDAASGATVLSNVRITPSDNTAVGVSLASVKLWGLDTDLALARINGQRLTETAQLAKRIDISGVSAFGLETLMAPAMEAYNEVVIETIDGATDGALSADPEIVAAMNTTPTRYDLGVGRVILHDVVLRPWEMTPARLAADSDWAEIMPIVQPLAAFYRSFGIDTAAMYDMTVDFAFDQAGSQASMTMVLQSMGYRGWRGWDVDLGIARGMQMAMDMPLPAPAAFDIPDDLEPEPATPAPSPALASMAMSMTMGDVDHAGLRLDELAGYLARGVMPPRTEADLLSGGVMTLRDLKVTSGGQPLYSMGAMTLDASTFHWLIPAALRLKVDDYAFDIAGFSGFVQDMAATSSVDGASESEEVARVMAKAMPVLTKYGLAAPSFDYEIGWDWNPGSGAITADYGFGLDGYGRVRMTAAGATASFNAASALVPADASLTDGAALQKLFTDVSSLKSAEAVLTDEGGLEKAFGLAVEMAKAFKDEMPPEMATFANMTPASLRGMSSSGAYLAADSAAQLFPPARDLLRPFAAWVTSGGEVRVVMKPKQPLTAAQFEAGPPTPESVVDVFGLTVVHTPPPGAKAN